MLVVDPHGARDMDDTQPALTPDTFLARLRSALREQPRGTALVFAYLREDDAGEIDEEFELTDCEWLDWRERAQAWLVAPAYSERYRAQLLRWVAQAGAARRTFA
jgi:hypothetical protein